MLSILSGLNKFTLERRIDSGRVACGRSTEPNLHPSTGRVGGKEDRDWRRVLRQLH